MSYMRAFVAGSFFAMVLTGAQVSYAGEFASEWQNNPYARVRLISTGYPDGKNKPQTVSAGLQIELDPGWKTYWRIPGDSGIPPEINWDGSTNVKSIEIRWPVPLRLIDEFGMSIGYKNEIVLPLKIVPKDKTVLIHLALELNYAVCSDICLPVSEKMTLDIKPGNQNSGPFKRKLRRFVEKVPKTSEPSQGLRVKKLELSGDGEDVVLTFDVANPRGDGLVDVFIEGDDALFFGTPRKITNKGDISQVEVRVSGATSAKALAGNKLRFTLVGKKTSVDQYWTIGG